MKKQFLYIALFVILAFASCTNPEDPTKDLKTANLYVEISNSTRGGAVQEGDTLKFVALSPVSYDSSDVRYTFKISGTAELDKDYKIVTTDKKGNEDPYTSIESITNDKLVVIGKQIKAGLSSNDVVSDAITLRIIILDDGEADGEEDLVIELEGGEVIETGRKLDGGKGNIRKKVTYTINDKTP